MITIVGETCMGMQCSFPRPCWCQEEKARKDDVWMDMDIHMSGAITVYQTPSFSTPSKYRPRWDRWWRATGEGRRLERERLSSYRRRRMGPKLRRMIVSPPMASSLFWDSNSVMGIGCESDQYELLLVC